MDNKYLLDNERVILQSDDDIVSFTNFRLRYAASEFGKAHIASILLEKISLVEVYYRSKTIYLILALFAIVGVLIAEINRASGEFSKAGVVIGVLFIILYLTSRKHVVTILSDGGGKINFHTKGMKQEQVLDFVNKLESSMKQRREELK